MLAQFVFTLSMALVGTVQAGFDASQFKYTLHRKLFGDASCKTDSKITASNYTDFTYAGCTLETISDVTQYVRFDCEDSVFPNYGIKYACNKDSTCSECSQVNFDAGSLKLNSCVQFNNNEKNIFMFNTCERTGSSAKNGVKSKPDGSSKPEQQNQPNSASSLGTSAIVIAIAMLLV